MLSAAATASLSSLRISVGPSDATVLAVDGILAERVGSVGRGGAGTGGTVAMVGVWGGADISGRGGRLLGAENIDRGCIS